MITIKKYLSDLKVGQTGKIVKILINDKPIRRHLLDLGLTFGTIVTVKKISPSGDPIDISLRGYQLCLRKKDLEKIEIELIEQNSLSHSLF